MPKKKPAKNLTSDVSKTEVQKPANQLRGKKAEAPKVEVVSIRNLSPYVKVDPNTNRPFPANKVVKDVIMNNWIEVQVAAKILEVVK